MPRMPAEPLPFAPDETMLAAAVERLGDLGAAGGGAVAAAQRRAALQAFLRARGRLVPRNLGWTSGRVAVDAVPFAAPRSTAAAGESDLPALAVENAGGLVHAGSTYLEPRERAADRRVTLTALADARSAAAAIHLQVVAPETDRYTALATAFQNCGAFVDVPAGVVPEAPLQLLWLGTPGPPAAVFPHTVIRLGAGARATIVERHLSGNEAFVAGIVEAELGPGARLDYVAVQQTDETAHIAVRRRARCAADATVAWHVADLGGARVRSACGAQLHGTGAAVETNAFAFARAFARCDAIVEADHEAGRTHSRATIRRAATDRARGRLGAALRFGANAVHGTATLRDDGLILSRSAYLDAAPVVAVPAHHVSASQSTNIGSLDEDELFYIQSRGITRALAERMMALAFFEAAIARFPSEALRDEVRTALDARLDEVPETFA